MNKIIKLTNIVINYGNINFDFIADKGFQGLAELEKDPFGVSYISQGNLKRLVLPNSKKVIFLTPDNKLILEDASGEDPEKSSLIMHYLISAVEVIKLAVSKPYNHGFNYQIILSGVSETNLPNGAIEDSFNKEGIKIHGIGYTLTFYRSRVKNVLSISQSEDKSGFAINLNSHYKDQTLALPNYEELNKEYKENWAALNVMLDKLFK